MIRCRKMTRYCGVVQYKLEAKCDKCKHLYPFKQTAASPQDGQAWTAILDSIKWAGWLVAEDEQLTCPDCE